MEELERENAFYEAHRDEFREKYYDKYLLITGEELYGVYDKFADAAKTALDNYEPGDFLIHKPSDEDRIIEISPGISVFNPKSKYEKIDKGTITCVEGELKAFSYAW